MRLLQGVRALDLGAYIAGPYTAALLAELVADGLGVPQRPPSLETPGRHAYGPHPANS